MRTKNKFNFDTYIEAMHQTITESYKRGYEAKEQEELKSKEEDGVAELQDQLDNHDCKLSQDGACDCQEIRALNV